MLATLGLLPYALLFVLVFGYVANTTHTWLEFGAGLRRSVAVALALAVGVAAGAGLCWLTWNAPFGECIDYASGIYRSC